MITLNHSMIKELSLAIVLGLLIGFGLTGTYFYVKQNKNQQKNTPNIVIPTTAPENNNPPSPNPLPTSEYSSLPQLKVNYPQNNDIISTSKVTIKGQSSPNSLIIITTPLKNYHLSADVQGLFSQEISLEAGYNDINLTTIDENDQENHLELFITYSTTKLEWQRKYFLYYF